MFTQNLDFAVVEFLTSEYAEQRELAVVPTIWLNKNNKKCYWPERLGKYKSLDEMVCQKISAKNWPSRKILKVHDYADSYDEATKHLDVLIADTNKEIESSDHTDSLVKSFARKGVINNTLQDQPPLEYEIESASSSIGKASVSSAFEDQVIKRICTIEENMEQQTMLLVEIKRIVNSQNTPGVFNKPEGLPAFPMDEINKFEEFDATLTASEDMRSYMRTRIAAIGGGDLEQTARNVMRFLMTNELAKAFNWKGKEKIPFERKNILGVILESLRQSFAGEGTDHSASQAIKNWLKYAPARAASKKPK